MLSFEKTVRVALSAALAFAVAGAGTALAQVADFPSRPIRLVIPSAAGGGFDILGRHVAQRLTEDYKVNVVAENRVGAGSIQGTEHVARSAPDGYTLLLGGVSNIALNPALFRKLPYDARRDFVPVGFLATYPTVFLIPASMPVSTLREFVDLARDNPGSSTLQPPVWVRRSMSGARSSFENSASRWKPCTTRARRRAIKT